jgi:hypothetical protein
MERAEALFERLVGYQLNLKTYSKIFPYSNDHGVVIRNDKVVEILDVKAKATEWVYENFFGGTGWSQIDLSHIVISEKDGVVYVTLPPTLFGTSYSDVEITYTAGHERIPDDIIYAITEINRLLEDGTISEWNCTLPVPVLEVIEKYKKEVID